MRTRADAVAFWLEISQRKQLGVCGKPGRGRSGPSPIHWGKCEIRRLLDFIYDGYPHSAQEEV